MGIGQNALVLQILYEVCMRSCDTIPPLTLCHCITTKDDPVTTLYTPWATPSVTIARNSYVHARNHLRMLTLPNLEAEILNFERAR